MEQQYITKIRTDRGDLQIDYNALANLPNMDTDTTLKLSGKFADAKATGDAIDALNDSIDALRNEIMNGEW